MAFVTKFYGKPKQISAIFKHEEFGLTHHAIFSFVESQSFWQHFGFLFELNIKKFHKPKPKTSLKL